MKNNLPKPSISKELMLTPLSRISSNELRTQVTYSNLIYVGLGKYAPVSSQETWIINAHQQMQKDGVPQYLVNLFYSTYYSMRNSDFKENVDKLLRRPKLEYFFIYLLHANWYDSETEKAITKTLMALQEKIETSDAPQQPTVIQTIVQHLQMFYPPELRFETNTLTIPPIFKTGDIVYLKEDLQAHKITAAYTSHHHDLTSKDLTALAALAAKGQTLIPAGTPLTIAYDCQPSPSQNPDPHYWFKTRYLSLATELLNDEQIEYWQQTLNLPANPNRKRLPNIQNTDEIPLEKLHPFKLVDNRNFQNPTTMEFVTEPLSLDRNKRWKVKIIPNRGSDILALDARYFHLNSEFTIGAASDNIADKIFYTPHNITIDTIFNYDPFSKATPILQIGITDRGRIQINSKPDCPVNTYIDQRKRMIEVQLLFDIYLLNHDARVFISHIVQDQPILKAAQLLNDDGYPTTTDLPLKD